MSFQLDYSLIMFDIVYPSAYSLISRWYEYVKAVHDSKNPESKSIPHAEFGILGTPGFSVGGFLLSPYAQTDEPDVQLTVFPVVSRDFFVPSSFFLIGL